MPPVRDVDPSEVGNTVPVPAGNPVVPPANNAEVDELKAQLEAERSAKAALEKERNDLQEKNRHLYARVKGQNPPSPDAPPAPPASPPKPETSDPFVIAKEIASMKGLDEAEIDHLALLAKTLNKPVKEIRESNEYKYWLNGKREEDRRNNNVPPPAGSVPAYSLPSPEDIAKMSLADIKKLETEFQSRKQARGGI